MSYLEQLKSENMLQGAHPKHPKPTFGGFGGTIKRPFSEKKAPPERITTGGTPHKRNTGTGTDDLDAAERIFNFLADQGRACSESEILAAVAGDETKGRNILFRLAAERVIEYLGRGLYQVDAPMPELPAVCPLRTGGGVPRGCAYHPKFFSRLLETGTLTTGGHCPLVRVCTHKTFYEEGVV